MAKTQFLQFYEFGNGSVFKVAATANGVTYNPSTPVPSPRSTGTMTTGTTSATSRPNGAISRFEVRGLTMVILSLGLLGGWMAVV